MKFILAYGEPSPIFDVLRIHYQIKIQCHYTSFFLTEISIPRQIRENLTDVISSPATEYCVYDSGFLQEQFISVGFSVLGRTGENKQKKHLTFFHTSNQILKFCLCDVAIVPFHYFYKQCFVFVNIFIKINLGKFCPSQDLTQPDSSILCTQ